MKIYRISRFVSDFTYRSSAATKQFAAMQQKKVQRGISMIEALVTMAVLSGGLLGLAFLQAQGLQFNTSSYARSQASILASDMIDNIRINAANLDDYDTGGSYTPDTEDCDVTEASDADNDRDCWFARLQDALPSGTGSISVDGTTGTVTVTVTWTERPSGRFQDGTDVSSLSESQIDEFRIQRISVEVAI